VITLSKFRIAIQEFEGSGKPKDFRNVMIISDESLDSVKSKIILLFRDSHTKWARDFYSWLEARITKASLFKRHGVGTDLFDHRSVGKDISVEEFIRNEIDIELIESRSVKR